MNLDIYAGFLRTSLFWNSFLRVLRWVSVLRKQVTDVNKRSSVKEHSGDALARRGDEGRGTLRKATGRCDQPLIRRCPNGETHHTCGIVY
jgi:hypothetical protein